VVISPTSTVRRPKIFVRQTLNPANGSRGLMVADNNILASRQSRPWFL
jgi:hypothetical protein